MTTSTNNISYPCLVLDIGTSRFPKSIITDGIEDLVSKVKITECAYCYLETPDSDFDENNMFYIDIQNNLSKVKDFVDQIDTPKIWRAICRILSPVILR